MKIHEYNEMMSYLTRPAMAYGGRVGFFKGSDTTKATDLPGIFTKEYKTGKKVYIVDMKRGSTVLHKTFDSLEDAQDAYKKFVKKNPISPTKYKTGATFASAEAKKKIYDKLEKIVANPKKYPTLSSVYSAFGYKSGATGYGISSSFKTLIFQLLIYFLFFFKFSIFSRI